jgi:hypothetical protein
MHPAVKGTPSLQEMSTIFFFLPLTAQQLKTTQFLVRFLRGGPLRVSTQEFVSTMGFSEGQKSRFFEAREAGFKMRQMRHEKGFLGIVSSTSEFHDDHALKLCTGFW